jgi:Outer membrane receptor proteins, mostly Fe transport
MAKLHKIRAALLLGGIAFPAFAVSAQAQPASDPQAKNQTNAMADIIVTAQRREERLQDVPVAITALSSEALEKMNVTQPQDLYGSVPSLVVGPQGQASRDVQSFSIRGQSTGFLSSPAVAQYLADVPVPASITLNLQGAPGMFEDVENVQVLKGPQGTLFGRNTTGGAVLFVPRRPTNDVNGYLEGSYGNYNLNAVSGAFNVPIIDDQLMVRVSGTYRDRDGFTKDLVFNKRRDDIHYYALRLGILAKPTDTFENYTLVYYANSDNNGAGQVLDQFNIGGLKGVGFCADTGEVFGPNAVNCNVYRQQEALQAQNGPRTVRPSVDAFSKIRSFGVINTTTIELSDDLTLKNIVSYQELTDNYAVDQDGTPIQQYELNQNAGVPTGAIPGLSEYGLPLFGYTRPVGDLPRDDIGQVTEELQLQGYALDHKLDYTVGFFHFNATPRGPWGGQAINYCPALFTGLCQFQTSRTRQSNRSNAVYAQATLDFGAFSPSLDGLRLTAGARYTWDRIKGRTLAWRPNPDGLTSVCTSTNVPVSNDQIDPTCGFSNQLNSKAPTWLIGLDYKFTPDILGYAKVSRGYKSGGFNSVAVRPETQTFQPEKLTSYEVGIKSEVYLGSMPLRFNADYFYLNYSNIQRPTSDVNLITQAGGAQILAAKARIQGVEAEASIRPFRGFELGGNFSYTDPKYTEFQQVVFTPQTACNGAVGFGEVADLSCLPFQFVTKWIYNIHASLDVPLSDKAGSLSFYAAYSHVSSQPTSPTGDDVTDLNSVLEPYGQLNASITWSDMFRKGLSLSVFGTNLTDKLYRVGNSNSYNGLLVNTFMYGEPRMYGVKLRMEFGG